MLKSESSRVVAESCKHCKPTKKEQLQWKLFRPVKGPFNIRYKVNKNA